ncbi:hypothetical protein [Alloactinosynnema sp. L-07]|nr:hypothetical protein [Alloactinosynnema sp. L-07]
MPTTPGEVAEALEEGTDGLPSAEVIITNSTARPPGAGPITLSVLNARAALRYTGHGT